MLRHKRIVTGHPARPSRAVDGPAYNEPHVFDDAVPFGSLVLRDPNDLVSGYNWLQPGDIGASLVSRGTSLPPAWRLDSGIDIRDFGALPSPADSTAAFDAAGVKAAAVGGAPVIIPPGRWRVSIRSGYADWASAITIRPGVSFVGRSRHESIVELAPSQANTVRHAMFCYDAADNVDVGRVSFEHFTIDQNAANNPEPTVSPSHPRPVVFIGHASQRARFTDMDFVNLNNVNTLYISGVVVPPEIRRCRFVATPNDGAPVHDESVVYVHPRYSPFQPDSVTVIVDCDFIGTPVGYGAAIETHGGAQLIAWNRVVNMGTLANISGITDRETQHVLVAHNIGIGLQRGVSLFSVPYLTNISDPLQSVSILHNSFELESDAFLQHSDIAAARGIYGLAQLPIHDLRISGNHIRFRPVTEPTGALPNGTGVGIYLSSEPSKFVNRHWSVTDNLIEGALTYGMHLSATVSGVRVTGNVTRNAGQLTSVHSSGRGGCFCQMDGSDVRVEQNDTIDDQPSATVSFAVSVVGRNKLAVPSGVAAVQSGTGTLGTGTKTYVVTARSATGETLPSTEATVEVTGPTGRVSVTWTANTLAGSYGVYGRESGLLGLLAIVTTNAYADTGADEPGDAPPVADTTYRHLAHLTVLDNKVSQVGGTTITPVLTSTVADTERAPLIRQTVASFAAPVGNCKAGSRLHDATTGLIYEQVTAPYGTTWAVVGGRPLMSADRGDANVTLTAADAATQRFATTLTANRTVTLPTGIRGLKYRIVRTGVGSFTLAVSSLKTIPADTAAWVEVEHDGAAWRLTGYGAL